MRSHYIMVGWGAVTPPVSAKGAGYSRGGAKEAVDARGIYAAMAGAFARASNNLSPPHPESRPGLQSPMPVATAVSLSLLGDALLYAVLPSQAEALGIPLVLVGVLLSANRVVRFVTNSWAGAVYAGRGRHTPFFLAMVGATVTTFSYAVPWGFWPFLAARAAWGTCWSYLRMGQLLAVLEWAGADERGRWIGRAQAVSRIGTIFSLVAGGYLTDRVGYTFTIVLFGVLTAVGALIAWRERERARHQAARSSSAEQPAPVQPSRRSDAEPHATATLGGSPDDSPWVGVGSMHRTGQATNAMDARRLKVTYVAGFAQGFVTFGLVMGTLALLLVQRFGQEVSFLGVVVGVATLSGWLLGARWLLEISLAPISGRLSDRLGRRTTVTLGALLQGIMLLAVAHATDASGIFLTACGLFAAAVVFSVSLDATATDLAAAGRPSVIMGRYNTANDAGAALGPVVGYVLSETIGLTILYTGVATLLAIIAGLVAWGFRGSKAEWYSAQV